MAGLGLGVDVAAQHRLDARAVVAIHRLVKGGHQTIEDLAHLAHLLGHGHVPCPQLAQRAVHVLEEQVEQRLAELMAGLLLDSQTPKQQRQVQRDHVETAGDRVGNAPVGIEDGLPGLRHNGCIDGINSVGGRVFPEQVQYHQSHSAVLRDKVLPVWKGSGKDACQLASGRL